MLGSMNDAEKDAALDEFIRRVIVSYACVGTVLAGLGLFVRYSPLPEINTERETSEVAAANISKKSILEFPHLMLGALAIFLHVGTQVIAIDIIGYANSMNIDLLEAKVFPSYTLFATICGCILRGIICIPKYVSQLNALRFCTLLGAVLPSSFRSLMGKLLFLVIPLIFLSGWSCCLDLPIHLCGPAFGRWRWMVWVNSPKLGPL